MDIDKKTLLRFDIFDIFDTYLLNVFLFKADSSSTVHVYTQTVHRTTQ